MHELIQVKIVVPPDRPPDPREEREEEEEIRERKDYRMIAISHMDIDMDMSRPATSCSKGTYAEALVHSRKRAPTHRIRAVDDPV